MAKQCIFNNKGASAILILQIKINSWIFFSHDESSADATILAISHNFLALKSIIFHLQSLSDKELSNSSISLFCFFSSSYLYYMFSKKKKCYLYIICNKILIFGQIVLCLHVYSLCKHFICIYYLFYMKHNLVFFFLIFKENNILLL